MAASMKKPSGPRSAFYVLIVVLLAASLLSSINLNQEKPETVGLNTFIERVKAGEIASVEVQSELLRIETTDGEKLVSQKETSESLSELFSNYDVPSETAQAIDVTVKNESVWQTFLLRIVPTLILAIGLVVVAWFMVRQMQGAQNKAMSFGQSSVRDPRMDKKSKTTFKDVAGAYEAKEELAEIIEFLKNPKKFDEVGARIPRGVLLMGPPGTGKTLLARAVAGEANAPFFHMSGSEFVEMFVGVGASRVRDLFNKAKKAAPCIIFIDEIDAVGRQRGAGLGGGHDEREQTLNQILVEMDGFEENSGVIVMAATNRPDVLDPALLRPGRFDRQVTIDTPDLREREEILKLHAKNKPLEESVNLKVIAQRTTGFSGADLFNVLNEAAILTARENKKKITNDILREAIEKVLIGPARKSRVISDREKKVTAYHEAGHAIVGHILGTRDEVHKISIISRGRAGGYTMKLPQEENRLQTRGDFLNDLAMMLGGRIAEDIVFGDVSTGASDDLKKATGLAMAMIKRYGMDADLGPRTYGKTQGAIFLGRDFQEERDYSDTTAEKIDEAVRNLLKDADKRARDVFTDQRKNVDKIVNILLEKETIEKEEFEEIMGAKKSADDTNADA